MGEQRQRHVESNEAIRQKRENGSSEDRGTIGRRRFLGRSLQLTGAAALAILGFRPRSVFAQGGSESASSGAGPTAGVARGEITYLEGEVAVDDAAAEFGQPVGTDNVIQTGPDSLCEVVFLTGNIIRIDAETIATLALTDDRRSLSIERGSVATVAKNLTALTTAGAERLRIETPTAVGGVRGTSFFVRVFPDGRTYLCTCNGSVHLATATEDDGETIRAPHHRCFYLTRTDAGITVEETGMIYHDDSLIEDVAARIGREIDWTTVPPPVS